MLRVTIELLPHGSRKNSQVIAEGLISNMLTHADRPAYGAYFATFEIKDQGEPLTVDVPSHKRSRPVWYLLKECLDELFKSYPDLVD